MMQAAASEIKYKRFGPKEEKSTVVTDLTFRSETLGIDGCGCTRLTKKICAEITLLVNSLNRFCALNCFATICKRSAVEMASCYF